ncbi:putative reverse transcriptase domain-containing protein, partial [Tanacetum coccineum]
IGNGRDTSALFDNWCPYSPIAKQITPRDVANAGYSMVCSVADLVADGAWNWPQCWLMKAPNIRILPASKINCNTRDLLQWGSRNGTLQTQDKLRQWDVEDADLTLIRCLLCDEVLDSHSHLFFECSFSSKVCCYVRRLAELESVPPLMHLIVFRLLSISTKRTARSIIGRLVLATTSYFIWLKRNYWLFKNTRKSPEDVRDMVMNTVRLKLLFFWFKHTSRVQELLAKWNMPSGFRIYSS